MGNPHTVVIIGCGNIAGGFDAARDAGAAPLTHAGAYAADPHFRIAACVEPDALRREAFMTRWDVAQGVADVAELRGRFDVVSICSPTALHARHVDAALALCPRLLFCEKPVSPTVAETERLLRRCREAGVLLAVAHNRRWDPAVQRLADELRGGRWGTLRAVTAGYNKGVLNNGSHLLDLLQLLVGPLQLHAAGAALHDHWSDDPSVPALLYGPAGVPVQLGITHAADHAYFELTLHTSEACIAMEDGGLAWRIRRRVASPHFNGYHTLDAGQVHAGELLLSTRRAVHNLHEALTGRAPLASTGDSALAAQRLCETIRDAARAPSPPSNPLRAP